MARVSCTPEEVASADLVVVVTDHDDFDYDLIATNAQRILDTRRRIQTPTAETL